MKRWVWALVWLVSWGCAGPQAASVDEESESSGPRPVTLEMAGESAPWWEAPKAWRPAEGDETELKAEPVARGQNCALARIMPGSTGYLGYCLGDERAHLLEVPDGTAWVGLGGEDRLYAADEQGRVYRGSVEEGVGEKGARLKGATMWDASAGGVVASDGATVWLATDGGESFEAVTPEGDIETTGVFVRPDGLVVVSAARSYERVVFVSADGGASWDSLAGPSPNILRWGMWISDPKGTKVLSKDGSRFLPPGPVDVHSWTDFFALSDSYVDAYPHHGVQRWTQTTPKAPTKEKPTDVTSKGFGRIHGLACQHVSCLGRRPELPVFKTRYRFLGHSLCAPEHQGDSVDCEPGAPLGHAIATISFRENRPIATGAAPELCSKAEVDEFVYSVGTLGVAVCESPDKKSVATAGEDLEWSTEVEAPGEEAEEGSHGGFTLQVPAADGTIVVEEGCNSGEAPCRGWVRAPVPSGGAEAWRRVQVDDAVSYRALPGGGALVIVVRGDRDSTQDRPVDFIVSRPDGTQETVIRDADVPTNDPYFLRVGRDGRILAVPNCVLGDREEIISKKTSRVRCVDENETRMTRVLHTDGSWRR